jgi:DNA polymerase delta subunit 3
MDTSVDAILAEVGSLVEEQLQVVTYKWLARHFGIPYDTAKRVLFQFITKRGNVGSA